MLTARGWQQLPVIGEAVSAEYLWPAPSSQQLFAAPEDFGVLFAPEGLVPLAETPAVQHQVLVAYAPGADRASLDSEIRHLADSAGADDVKLQADQPSNKALSLDLQGFRQMAWLFPAMFLLAAGLATYLLPDAHWSTRSGIRSARSAPTGSRALRCCGTISATGSSSARLAPFSASSWESRQAGR